MGSNVRNSRRIGNCAPTGKPTEIAVPEELNAFAPHHFLFTKSVNDSTRLRQFRFERTRALDCVFLTRQGVQIKQFVDDLCVIAPIFQNDSPKATRIEKNLSDKKNYEED
jgi:hypothetical protein